MQFPRFSLLVLLAGACDRLFEIVAGPTNHPKLAGSGKVMEVKDIIPQQSFIALHGNAWFSYYAFARMTTYDPPYRFFWQSSPFRWLGQFWGFYLVPCDARATFIAHMTAGSWLSTPAILACSDHAHDANPAQPRKSRLCPYHRRYPPPLTASPSQ